MARLLTYASFVRFDFPTHLSRFVASLPLRARSTLRRHRTCLSRRVRDASFGLRRRFHGAAETSRMLDPPRPKAGRALTGIEPPSDVLCRFLGTAASAPSARQLPPRTPLAGPNLAVRMTLARRTRFVSPIQPGPRSAAPVRTRRSFGPRRLPSCLTTPRCPLDPFVSSCPRIGLSLHLIDVAWGLRTTSPSSHHRTRQRCHGFFPASAVHVVCLATPQRARRKMRPTDFCFSTLVLRAPTP